MATASTTDRTRVGRRRLGRGLTSLLGAPVEIDTAPRQDDLPEPSEAAARPTVDDVPRPTADGIEASESAIRAIAMTDVHARPGQPRQQFDDAALGQLAESIRAAGLMQPILVRTRRQGGYEIIAGERRWRAARSLGMQAIPAIVRDLGDEACAEWSLIENLQREDLNPIERAEAFGKLIDEHRLSHQDLADRIGLDRSSISNHLRLNELDDECKAALRRGSMSMGHAKALLSVTNIERRQSLARRAIRDGWSVRQLERSVRALTGSDGAAPDVTAVSPAAPTSAHLGDLQRRLGEHLGTKVSIRPGRKKGSGKLIIEFFDFDQFEGIMHSLQFPLDA